VARGLDSGNLTTMAYVVRRGDGRYEIRESVVTPKGPRARTLAIFRVLSEQVLDLAQARARTPFDRAKVAARAEHLGVPAGGETAAGDARRLLAGMRRGDRPPRALAEALRAELSGSRPRVPDSIPPVLDWLEATPERRGAALRDLLRLASRIPPRASARGPLAYPLLRSHRDAA